MGYFHEGEADGKVPGYEGYGICYDTSKGHWAKAKSIECDYKD